MVRWGGGLVSFFLLALALSMKKAGFAGSSIVALIAILFLLQLNNDIKKSSPLTQQ